MYQIIGLFVAVIVLLLAGWGAVTSLKGELKADIDRVRDELKEVKNEIKEVDAKVGRVNDRIDSVSNSLHSEIQNITLEVGKVIGRAETSVNA